MRYTALVGHRHLRLTAGDHPDTGLECIQQASVGEGLYMPFCRTALLALVGLAVTNTTSAQDSHLPDPAAEPIRHWNQWRGPARDGQTTGPAWPAKLEAETLQRQWHVEVGESYSGPVCDAERVYTTATLDQFEECVWAIDRKTGKRVWEATWEGAMKVPFFAARNGSWIRATPALHGDRLYVAGMLDVLVCLDAPTGKEHWRVDFKERYGTPKQPFGFVCSPLVHDGAVYVQTAAGLIKLDAATGESIWRGLDDDGNNMMNAGAFSSPVIATIADREQIVVQGRTRLSGVDLATGNELWGVDIKSFRGMNILTPVPFGDGVFTSAYGGRAHYFAVGKNAKGGDGAPAMHVEQAWTNRAQGNMTSPVVIDGHAYLYLRSKRFCCVDLAAGEVAWISEPLGDTYWSIVAQGDRMLALTDSGELLMIRANTAELEIESRMEVAEEETWAHLAVDGDQVFVRGLHGLTAFAWK